ncbi:REP element-mobilizing transposase RayT [Bacillus ectoiniformans]|uniref:transposase n=1 Tax=Bacillus ectoiniformans TaxID=1494429 RepID=UPI001EF941B5|nr:transposase [Bacillus ectoiniformans]MBM7648452.1 REP element-mobilizing transposase RayT [Bacillus ectoiniformans]
MARKHRQWFPGAIYHITNRGNRQAALFYDRYDWNKYLSLLEETRKMYPFYLHTYCLMSNHIHLQVETIDHHPQYMMKMLNTHYALYFNKRYQVVGHVFQGRYGAKLIDTVSYHLKVSKYIHLNPLEANMVKSPDQYPWSSHAVYVSDRPSPHVTTENILSYFPDPKKEYYRRFVEDLPFPSVISKPILPVQDPTFTT